MSKCSPYPCRLLCSVHTSVLVAVVVAGVVVSLIEHGLDINDDQISIA